MVTIVEDFLADLAPAGKSAHTVRAYRAYRGDLRDFARFFTGPIERITAGVLRAYLGGLADKAPATRARREAALASLLAWAYRGFGRDACKSGKRWIMEGHCSAWPGR